MGYAVMGPPSARYRYLSKIVDIGDESTECTTVARFRTFDSCRELVDSADSPQVERAPLKRA
jgi:hypothetical protein